MAKKKSQFTCQSCTYKTPKWMGRCPECGEWNSFVEEEEFSVAAPKNRVAQKETLADSVPMPITEVDKDTGVTRQVLGLDEFDRVMGGGVVPGSLSLIGGEPGVGKSTLLMNICGLYSKKYPEEKVLYVSGEESMSQVASRAKRLGVNEDNLYLLYESNWQKISAQIKKLKPKFLVLDSIQTLYSQEIQSAPGTVSQIREVTYEVLNHAKALGITSFIVGHVTKEGSIAGPKILEHMVDTVVYFEGDQLGHYRMLRGIKNRFGNTNEVGIFEMREDGLQEIRNPSQYFVESSLNDDEAFGRSLSCIMKGTRALFVEIQALVVENKYGNGRRTTQGVDSNRLAMLVAVLEKYVNIPLGFNDIYANVVGGIKLSSRETDLSLAASLLSSYRKQALDSSTVYLGEVGLTGEIRPVAMIETRLKELDHFGYKRLITSERIAREYQGKYKIQILGIRKIQELPEIIFEQ